MKYLYMFVVCLVALHADANEAAPAPAEVMVAMKNVADWQIEHLTDDIGREHENDNKLDAWTFGALYVGMGKWAAMAGDDRYSDFLKATGDELDWEIRAKYHADGMIVGQMYIEMFRKYGDPKMLAGIQEKLEWIKANPSQQPINLNHYKHTQRWTWCDALFMAPPAWAKLAKITGDASFNEFMFAEYKATYDHLYDPEEKLFYRDEHYIDRRDDGRKVFWSRGNGWVFGSLPLIISELPEGEIRDWFVALYKDMAPAVAALQMPKGHWAMSLLCADKYPTPETSGTAFFTFGLAWGINNGLLDRAMYAPVVFRGWNALTSHVTTEGLLGYVQPVGAGPGQAWPDKSEVYGVGAFLAAGSEVFKLVGGVVTPSVGDVFRVTQKVADWQIVTFEDQIKYRAQSSNTKKTVAKYWENPDDPKYDQPWGPKRAAHKWHDLEWHNGALYAGMNQWRKVSVDPASEQFLMMIGERNGWSPYIRPYHADDHTVGQFYLSLYEEQNDPAMLTPIQQHFDWILENKKTGSLVWMTREMKNAGEQTDCHNRWGWCDALFMAPPVWARLAKVTGEQKYLDFMDEEYHATYDLLWDAEDQLFWRDSSYFERREENGSKLYWARGNGWVFGGLALMIPDLPEDWEGRAFYVGLYKQMAESLKACQRADGTWSMGLLGGVEGYPNKETSGTSFFAFGLAWGINSGMLDRATYEPVVLKAWQGLVECVNDEGMLTWVQPVGAAPGDSFADKTEVYGIGAFLAAGSEIYTMLGGAVPAARNTSARLKTFATDTGWCWYEDPRAIIKDGKLMIGGISGKSGDAKVGVYDLTADQALGSAILYPAFQRDDHNSPVFHVRPDGSLLTVYAKHGNEKIHHYHISDAQDYLKWGPRKEFHHTYPDKRGVTYMNLYPMRDEGLLYCFFRDGQNYNPAFITSADEGDTWGNYTHFITHDIDSRQRPYARYVQVDENTVGISFTDAHPRQYGNSLYYAEFKDGAFYTVDGTHIKTLAEGPLRTSEAEKLYTGSEIKEWKGHTHSVSNSAWTCATATDTTGNPHIGYTLYLTHDDHRYRVTSWDGSKWNDREIAYGGTCLYDRESSYTGLFAFDPADPSRIYISTDVDPSTGNDLGGVHEIYTAQVGPTDEVGTIEWEQLTVDSEYKNIRPIVVSGEGYTVVVWLGGHPWRHYQDYETDALGLIIKRP